MEDKQLNEKSLDKEIREIEEYISKLKEFGIYTDFQEEDLKYNETRLNELKQMKVENQ